MKANEKKNSASRQRAAGNKVQTTTGTAKKKAERPALSRAQLRRKASLVVERLAARYPLPATHLHAGNAWELLVATILSAQCTDERVNKVTPELFRQWPDPHALATADQDQVEECIRSTGFFRSKAGHIIASAQRIVGHFNGKVPETMADLVTLPGVARKTANVVLWTAFGKNEGIAVDTHVKRIAARLGLTGDVSPEAVEKDLMELFPRKEWGNVNHRLVWFGRHVCAARSPQCGVCEFADICDMVQLRNDTGA